MAQATSSLAADAGVSQSVAPGTPLALSGAALFGQAPYTFSWTSSLGTSRFSNPAIANPTFDTTGLSAGTITVTLTVADGNGDTASDTITQEIANVQPPRVFTGTVLAGAPDEFVGAGLDDRVHNFALPAGLTRIDAVLDWGNALNDFDFELFTPSGASATGTTAQTSAKPEVAGVSNPAAGTWRANVYPFLVAADTYTLTITSPAISTLPTAHAGSYHFGTLDAQALAGSVSGGTAPFAFAWDLDGDGAFETTGASPATSFAVGTHAVKLRVTDASGFRVGATGSVVVSDVDRVLKLGCGGDPNRPFWAMEFTSTKNTCWIHGGHHTYFFGDAIYSLQGGAGRAFSVEQIFSPPTEYDVLADPFTTALYIESSMDGLTWTVVGGGDYALLTDRQSVDLAVEDTDGSFRFLRIREPLSAAQGLSGYLDSSWLDVKADVISTVSPSLAPANKTMGCSSGDLVEDFFDAHPCWFGGIDRYDAPSFWHTYVAGDGANLTRISGSFQVLPWRTDDWFAPIVIGDVDDTLEKTRDIKVYVQTSVDGIQWTNVATVQTIQGAPTAYSVDLPGGHSARFVRYFPDYHARYDQTAQFAPNHHPKAFMVDSSVTVEGLLPS